MTNGPVSGQSIAIQLVPNKTVFCWATAQAVYSQFVSIKNSSGTVVFTCQGASSQGGVPTQIGQGTFVASDPTGAYTVSIGINGGAQWSSVLWDSQQLTLGTTVTSTTFSFIAEDSTDQDYNDTCLSLVWFNSTG